MKAALVIYKSSAVVCLVLWACQVRQDAAENAMCAVRSGHGTELELAQ
jgi:hypothetical protein